MSRGKEERQVESDLGLWSVDGSRRTGAIASSVENQSTFGKLSKVEILDLMVSEWRWDFGTWYQTSIAYLSYYSSSAGEQHQAFTEVVRLPRSISTQGKRVGFNVAGQ